MRSRLLIKLILPMLAICHAMPVFAQHARTVQTAYHDNTSLWVLGQVASETVNGVTTESTTFDANSALPVARFQFGQLIAGFGYNADGTLANSNDAAGRTSHYGNWKRGIPQSITHADNTAILAVVNDHGWVTRVTDENGSSIDYGYDLMGRISNVTLPTGDTVAWTPTTQVFEQVGAAEHGIAGGHWRQTLATGNAIKVTYFDALWRPLVVSEYDAARPAETQVYTRFAYDSGGRAIFASYPSDAPNPSAGIWTEYDGLGRQSSLSQDSEQGLLVTTTAYSGDGTGAFTLVTEPGGLQTRTWYQAYGAPTYESPIRIQRPEGAVTQINRDVFGKPLSIVR